MENRKKYSTAIIACKRIGDIFIGTLILLLCLPLMAILVLCIWLDDHAPAIFTQQRLTKGRKTFTLYKFRSMTPGTEEDYSLTLNQDPRVTRVGRIIRKYRLDELPQLINVIRGDMSMVGPRPERPHIAEAIEKEIPQFADRLSVKAGLTGYAQVKGNYATPSEEKLMMDLYYIENFSLWLDLKLLMQTVGVMVRPEKAKGVEPENHEYFGHNGG